MTDTHECIEVDFDLELMQKFKDKVEELNATNDTMLVLERERSKRYEAFSALQKDYVDFHQTQCEPVSKKLTEIRSELQGMQATLLAQLIGVMVKFAEVKDKEGVQH